MKKFIMTAAMAALLSAGSCTGFFDLGEEKITDYSKDKEDTVKTYVNFINNDSRALTVYLNSERNSDNHYDVGGDSSRRYEIFPSTYYFYRNYYLKFYSKTIEWRYPEESTYNIKRGETIDVNFNDLTEYEKNSIKDVYVVLINETGSLVSFTRGSTVQKRLDDDEINSINNGASGLYKVTPGQTSVYGVQGDALNIDADFEEGYAYKITVTKSGANFTFTLNDKQKIIK